jgi:magnesium transporter
MGKFKRKHVKRKKGMPPGSFVYTGTEVSTSFTALHVYDSSDLELSEITQLPNKLLSPKRVWVDQRGLEDVQLVEWIGLTLGIHPLAIEDILNTHQRAKLEEYADGLFFVLHHISWHTTDSEIITEQIALYWNDQTIASFQELPDHTFKIIGDRLQDPTKKVRTSGPDYLAYAIIDYIVDSYFEALDNLAEQMANLQDRILPNANLDEVRSEISGLRHQMSRVKRAILPLREALIKLNRTDIKFIDSSNLIYFRDILDHVGQISDYLDTLSDELNATHELYQAEMTQRMNNVMKLLTIISTIFIPLSFIAGVYGMNFDNMPELRTTNGYFITLSGMFLAGLAMLFYFKSKKWL